MVLVDKPKWKGFRKRKMYCHLFASTIAELDEFAEKIGRKRAWFHKSKNGFIPHYDLDEAARQKAIELGAEERSTKECIRWYRTQTKW